MSKLNSVMDFIDTRAVVRRIAFFWVLWMSAEALTWTLEFAWVSVRPGMEVAAIIAAVWTPLAGLQAAVFKFYDSGRAMQIQNTQTG